MSAPDCVACTWVAEGDADGRWVYSDDLYAVCVPPAAEVPGWLMVILRRHAPPLTSELTAEEARALGPTLKRMCAAIEQVVAAERVYNVQWGEFIPHWTMLLAARTADIPPEQRHVEMIANRASLVDAEGAARVADGIRKELAS